MTPMWMTLLMTCAAFAAANVAFAAIGWVAWPRVRRTTTEASAATRARVAFAWRLGPTVLSASSAGIVWASFFAFEPCHAGEAVGFIIPSVAAAGALLVAASLLRGAGAWAASERLARAWTRHVPSIVLPGSDIPTWAIDTDFPLVAVVGVRQPRLVVARTVAERCSAGELAAIAAHERGHLVAGDNLRRLWLRSACDWLSWTGRAREMERAWQEATEDAADDHATASGAREVDLASALVTVARLAPARPMAAFPASAFFYRGDSIERRVRRILGRGNTPVNRAGEPPTWPRSLAPALLTFVTAAGLHAGLGRVIYDITERLIQSLP
jgi:hypothetical protein